MNPNVEEFEIFQGRYDRKGGNNFIWINAVKGLDEAKSMMQLVAAENPGQYFLFCTRTNTVMATVDTTRAHHHHA
jgi:hypothetical protein